jgi:hypothetical protein
MALQRVAALSRQRVRAVSEGPGAAILLRSRKRQSPLIRKLQAMKFALDQDLMREAGYLKMAFDDRLALAGHSGVYRDGKWHKTYTHPEDFATGRDEVLKLQADAKAGQVGPVEFRMRLDSIRDKYMNFGTPSPNQEPDRIEEFWNSQPDPPLPPPFDKPQD